MAVTPEKTPPSKRQRGDIYQLKVNTNKITPVEKIAAPRRRSIVTERAVSDMIEIVENQLPVNVAIDELSSSLRPMWGDPLAVYMARILIYEYSGVTALDLVDYLESRSEADVYRMLQDAENSENTGRSDEYTESTARSVIIDAIVEI